MSSYVVTCYTRWETQTHGMQTLWTSWFEDTYHREKQKKAASQKQTTPLGWPIPVQGMLWRPIEEMCTNSGRVANHGEMSCSTVQRTLLSISRTSQNLAVWILLADDVRRHQGVHPKVSKMLATRWHYSSQYNAPPLQPTSGDLQCLGHWLHGAIPKVPWQQVHPHHRWLHIKMGESFTL